MKSFFILFALCGAFSAQSQILKKTYHDYQKTKPDEVYYVNAQGQNNGLYTKYNYNGAKAVEATFLNGTLNGPGKEYYTKDGASKLKISGSYKNGEKHGQWITYTYVKYGQSYYDIMQSLMFNDKATDIFNTGIQTKYGEEVFNDGIITKETKYHMNGTIFYSANFENGRYSGDYLCSNDKKAILTKGTIGLNGKMIGLWTIPREENGDCPKEKHVISNVVYTQKIKFDKLGNLDTNFITKSYYLSGKLRDSVRVISLASTSGYNYSGFWYLCGKNTGNTGPYMRFYESGNIMQQGNYKILNGISREVGIWKFYNEDGSIKEEKDYDALLKQEKLDKEIADSVSKDHTQKIEYWFEVYNKANEAYIKLITLFRNRSNIKPIFGEFELVREYWPNQQSGYIQDVYITYKKPKLFPYFKEITEFYFDSKEAPSNTINKMFPMQVSDFTSMFNQNPKKYFSSIDNLEKITTLIPKMMACAENNTKELEKQLTTVGSIEEKIKIIENFQFEPK